VPQRLRQAVGRGGVVEDPAPLLVGEAEVDVARVAGPRGVGLGHERRDQVLLRRDLLHGRLEEERVVGCVQRWAVVQGDLELARPGLGVARLHRQAVGEHALADPAAGRLLARSHRDAVGAGALRQRHEVVGASREQRSGALAQQVELELQRAARLQAHAPRALHDPSQHLARRDRDRRTVPAVPVAQHERGPVVPRHDPQRRRVGDATDVRVAGPLRREVARVPRRPGDEIGLVDVQDPEDVAERHAVLQQPCEAADRDPLAAHDAVRVGAGDHHGLDALLDQAFDDAGVVHARALVPSAKPS
jgi:hypothetical protein